MLSMSLCTLRSVPLHLLHLPAPARSGEDGHLMDCRHEVGGGGEGQTLQELSPEQAAVSVRSLRRNFILIVLACEVAVKCL